MAVTSVILDIKANTDRALNDFKRFSAQLDNKFLISGLKLDVVRNALGQINREFQRAIGEQGLQAGQSLRAAQNQAALLTQTFKGFSTQASLDMAQQFSTAFNEIAVKAGGTAQDVQKALAATPFISTNLSEDMRKALGEGVLRFQRDFRRAGLTEDFGNIARQFLMGQLTAREMIDSGDAAQSFLGTQLMRSSGGNIDMITNAQQRSEAFYAALEDPEFQKRLSDMARRAYGFRAIIEDLNSTLFNPEQGIFGSLRQVTMSVRDKTTIFDETEKLVESVFGRQGLFVNFFKQIGKIFGIEDPLKVIVIGVRFITRQFEALNDFVQSPAFQSIVSIIKDAFQRTKTFFESVYSAVSSGGFNSESIKDQIRSAGEAVRNYIKRIADFIRGEDISKQTDFSTSIVGTLVEEIGKTLVTLISEIGGALIPKAGTIAAGLAGALIPALGGVLRAVFSNALTGTLGTLFLGYQGVRGLRAIGGIRDRIGAIRGGEGGIGGAVNRSLGRPFRSRGEGLPSSDLGSTQSFYRQVIYYLSRITNCVCGPGGIGSDIDVGGRGGRRSPRGPQGPGRIPGPTRGGIFPGTQYRNPIGPIAPAGSRGFPMEGPIQRQRGFGIRRGTYNLARELFVGDEYNPVPGYISRSGANVADRFNRRYGTGGARAVFGRRIGGLARGFGRGALIAGAVGLGASALFGGGSAQATEIDPVTGQPRVGVGEAFGRVGMGAAEGALTGAMFGPWGAAIGGVIGGGIALLDKGVRDAIGKFISSSVSNFMRMGGELVDGLKRNILGAFEGIKNFAAGIDLKTILINALVPGGQFTIQGLQSLGQFASKLNIFDAIKSGLDTISGFVGKILDGFRNNPATGWLFRETGGPVVRGASYVVGERGPELFSPSQNGTISSNRELMALGSRGYGQSNVSANFNIAINVSGGMAPGDVEALRAPVLAIVEEAWATATQGTVSRGAIA